MELHGEKLAADNKKVPPELADMIFEVQETLLQLRDGASRRAQERDSLRAQVASARQEVEVLLKDASEELRRNFERWDSSVNPNPDLSVQLKAILSRISYLRTLARDVERALEQHDLR